MILVDTSVLINFFRGVKNNKVEKLRSAIINRIPYGICSLVYMELLQGARTEKEYELLKEYLSTQTFYELKNGRNSYEAAAMNYMQCRTNGITVRSTIDLIIAQISIENGLLLLHDDSDFSLIAKVVTDLKEY